MAEPIYKDFQELVAKYAAVYKVGNGMDEGVKVGPLVSHMQRETVASHVEDALKKGAKLLYQSSIPEDAGPETSFFPVTVVADVTKDMLIYKKETFGPVVSISPFDGTEAEAVRLANDTEYGLASSVYSKDEGKAARIASKIQAGQVGINCYALENMNVNCPWVGHKSSGAFLLFPSKSHFCIAIFLSHPFLGLFFFRLWLPFWHRRFLQLLNSENSGFCPQ